MGDVQLLGGADQQPRIQFLFQGIDVGTDGGLGQIQLAGGFREALFSTTATKASNCLNSIG